MIEAFLKTNNSIVNEIPYIKILKKNVNNEHLSDWMLEKCYNKNCILNQFLIKIVKNS